MLQNESRSIVIVDRSRSIGMQLREVLTGDRVTKHVFDRFVPALELISCKKVDTVVVEFAADRETIEFCEEMKRRHVPIVYSSAPASALDTRQYGFSVVFTDLPQLPTMHIQYRRPRNEELGCPDLHRS
jgi:DNA-binding response OmpR family regulator